MSVAADCTSDGLSAVLQVVVLGHVLKRGIPLIRMEEASPPDPGTKLFPATEKGKLSTAPAITLDGRITSISGPLVMATVAVADFVASARLVAITDIALGEGATVGAE